MTRYTAKFVTLQNGIILSTRDGFAPNFKIYSKICHVTKRDNFVHPGRFCPQL